MPSRRALQPEIADQARNRVVTKLQLSIVFARNEVTKQSRKNDCFSIPLDCFATLAMTNKNNFVTALMTSRKCRGRPLALSLRLRLCATAVRKWALPSLLKANRQGLPAGFYESLEKSKKGLHCCSICAIMRCWKKEYSAGAYALRMPY